MIQIILGVIIVSIGIFVFYKYPMKSDVRQMTLGALFVILAIILKRLAVMVPFLGFPSLKITLEVLPLIVAGLTLQPGYCFIVSIATDFLGLVLANAGGFPFLGFTLNAVLQTEIPCLLKIYLNEKNERLLERIVKIVMVIISLLGCLYVFKINEVNISGSMYQVTLPIKFTIFVRGSAGAQPRTEADEKSSTRSYQLHAILKSLACFFLLFNIRLHWEKNPQRSDTNNVNFNFCKYENVNY